MFRLGEQKIRPGTYVRWYDASGQDVFQRAIGVGAAVIKSNWGPLEEVVTINDDTEISQKIGTGKGAKVVKEAFEGGAYVMNVVRIGKGGDEATLTLRAEGSEEEAIEIAKLATKHPTSRDFNITIRESLNVDEKEFIVYEDEKQIEKITFKAGKEENEVKNMVFAVNETSDFIRATEIDGAEKVLSILNEPLTGGSDPETEAQDYIDAFGTLEVKFFDALTVDSEDTSIHASLQAFVNRRLREGARIIGITADKVSEPFDKRKEHAKAFNDFAMIHVGNGFLDRDGEGIDGALAAGRVLGMMVSENYKSSLTKKSVRGSTGVHGELKPQQYNEAVESGMLMFSENSDGLAQVDYGINTLVSPSSTEDKGWKKVRRVRTRFELIDRIAITLDRQIGDGEGIDNGSDGAQHVITVANGIIDTMIDDGGLESGEMILDEKNPQEGDSAWFKFDNLVDLDGMEKIYLAFGFKY